MKLKLSSGSASLEYTIGTQQAVAKVAFSQDGVRSESKVDAVAIHLDSSAEVMKQQEHFSSFADVEDIINGVGHRVLDDKARNQINYIAQRDYREIKIYEVEVESDVSPFFEVALGNDRYDSRTMGAGELAILFLWWAIGRCDKQTLVLVEEPETHLSPASQEALSHFLMGSAVEKWLSVILSSHSPEIINCFADGQCVFLYRDQGGIRVVDGYPAPALLKTIGIKAHIDVFALVEDENASELLRRSLERYRPSYSRKVEIIDCKGEGNITRLLRETTQRFKAASIVGVYDGDLRGSVQQDVAARSTFLPGDQAIEILFRTMAYANPNKLEAATGSSDVGAILASIQGVDHHDWFDRLAKELGMSRAQLFPILFGIWIRENTNEQEAIAAIDELIKLTAPN